ncbi:MAG: TonB-dependent receptor [Bacteroidales bacterium]|nr:TonB-dependent receptor [Bacteroidales bacterium]
MDKLLKVYLFVFFVSLSGLHASAQLFNNSIVRNYDNVQKIQLLEEKFSVRIFYDSASIDKNVFNDLPYSSSSVEEALRGLLDNTELTFRKMQEAAYVLLPAEIVRSLAEKPDELLGIHDNTLVVGSLENYKRNKAAVINGLIMDGKSGTPLPGAIVAVKSLEIGVASDMQGLFSMSLKPGNYKISVSCIGFEDFNALVKVLSTGDLTIELFEKSIKLEEVAVYARRADQNITGDQMSLVEIDRKSIKELPLITGEKDLIRSFSLLPGIKSTGEFGTGISVRGGGNDQNLFLIEETPLYNTSHVFGLISAISPDIANNVSLYKGFIPAEFGERASSVIDIQLKRGNEKKYAANGGIGLFSSRLAIEGPVVKDKVSFLVAGRSSYSDWLLNRIPDVQLANSKANFYDIYAGINGMIAKRHRLFLMVYNSYDFFNYDHQLHYANKNTAGELKWNFSRSQVLDYVVSISYSDNSIVKKDLEYASKSYRLQNGIQSVSLRGDAIYNLNRHHAIKAGIQAIRYSVNQGKQDPRDTVSRALDVKLEANLGLETALYITDNITINNYISLNLGLRYSMFFNLGPYTVNNYQPGLPISEATLSGSTYYKKNELIRMYHGPEPRFSLRYQLNGSTSAKLSYSRNMQYLSLVSASAVQSPDDVWQLANTYFRPVISNAFAMGFYKNLRHNTLETSFEIYYRVIDNLSEFRDGARLTIDAYSDAFQTSMVNIPFESELINAIGRNYGAEIMLKKSQGDLEGWISYTYSRSLKKTNGLYAQEIIRDNTWYPSSYDKPHDLNTMLTYHYNRRLRVSANFTYSTGRAVTLPEAIYYTENAWHVTYRPRNSERLPDYHRLDLSVSFDESLRLKKKWKGSWTFSVLNVYGRKNAYSVFFKPENSSKENNYRSFGLYKLYIIGRPLPTLTYNFIF